MNLSKAESRPYVTKEYVSEENGRSHIWLNCPFCKASVKAYVWSLAGGGKRCECGAHIFEQVAYKEKS